MRAPADGVLEHRTAANQAHGVEAPHRLRQRIRVRLLRGSARLRADRRATAERRPATRRRCRWRPRPGRQAQAREIARRASCGRGHDTSLAPAPSASRRCRATSRRRAGGRCRSPTQYPRPRFTISPRGVRLFAGSPGRRGAHRGPRRRKENPVRPSRLASRPKSSPAAVEAEVRRLEVHAPMRTTGKPQSQHRTP